MCSIVGNELIWDTGLYLGCLWICIQKSAGGPCYVVCTAHLFVHYSLNNFLAKHLARQSKAAGSFSSDGADVDTTDLVKNQKTSIRWVHSLVNWGIPHPAACAVSEAIFVTGT